MKILLNVLQGENVENIVAMEAIYAAQGLDMLAPLTTTKPFWKYGYFFLFIWFYFL